jgi:hypothetical protein
MMAGVFQVEKLKDTFEPVAGNTGLVNRALGKYEPYWLSEESKTEAKSMQFWRDKGIEQNDIVKIGLGFKEVIGTEQDWKTITIKQMSEIATNLQGAGVAQNQIDIVGKTWLFNKVWGS